MLDAGSRAGIKPRLCVHPMPPDELPPHRDLRHAGNLRIPKQIVGYTGILLRSLSAMINSVKESSPIPSRVARPCATNQIQGSRFHPRGSTLKSPDAGVLPGDKIMQSPALKRTFQFLHRNWHKPINVNHLTVASKLSRRGLYKAFVKQLGHGPGHELRHIRIKHAQQLLVQMDWSYESIGEICGFNTANSFFVAFKRETGMSPGRYRAWFRQSAVHLGIAGLLPIRSDTRWGMISGRD